MASAVYNNMDYAHHLDDVMNYSESVLSGEKLANKYEILAVQRFIDELEKQHDEKHLYYFDCEKAIKAIRFIELLPHTKGKWAAARGKAKLIKLEPWQKFIIANIFITNPLRKVIILFWGP